MDKKLGLVRRASGMYYARMRVPKHLVPLLNKQEIKVSLRTNERAVANARLPAALKEINERLASVRSDVAALSEVLRAIPSTVLKQIARAWFAPKWEAAERELSQPLPSHVTREEAVDWLEAELFPIKGEDEIRELRYAGEAEALLKRAGYVDADFPSAGLLASYLKRGDIDLLEVQIRHYWNNDLSHNLRDALFRSFNSPQGESEAKARTLTSRGNELTLDEAINSFEGDAQRATLSSKNSRGYAPGFNLLREIVGGAAALASVNREHAKRVRDVLKFLPPNASKRFPNMSLVEAAKHAQAVGLQSIQATTATNILSTLSAFFNWAKVEHGISGSPFADLKALQKPRSKDEQRQPFSATQLAMLFSSDMYSQPYERVGCEQPGRYWVPLLALYHGARMNELCQLEQADVKIEDGLWCITFTEESAAGGKKTLKTASAHRTVPVHPTIFNLGFIDYCESRRGRKEERLFPELTTAKSGYLSDNFSKWFSRYRKLRGVTGPRINFHSFRHGFNDACRDADVPEPIVEQICGWAADDAMVKHYGRGHTTKRKADELAKVRFPSVEKLFPALQGVNDGQSVEEHEK